MLITDEQAKDRVLKALADEYSRKMLNASIQHARSVVELSREQNIPMSSAYRRVHEMIEAGLITVERSVVTDDGKRYDLYRSTVKDVSIRFGPGRVEIELTPNEDVISKFMRMWSYMRGTS